MKIKVLKSDGETVEIDGVREIAIEQSGRVQFHRIQSRDYCGNFLFEVHWADSPITINDRDAHDPRPRWSL